MPPKNQGQEKGQYNSKRYTPLAVAKLFIDNLPVMYSQYERVQSIWDIGAGSGVWGLAAKGRWSHAMLSGVEKEDLPKPSNYNRWYANTDFDSWIDQHNRFGVGHFWISNPPYDKAEQWFWQMHYLQPMAPIFMFLSAGFMEGKDRRRRIYEVCPPNLILQLDGRLNDKSVPGTKGSDKRGRIGMFWDFENPVRNGETRVKWIGSDNKDDYKVTNI